MRKNYFIKKSFQTNFLLRFVALTAIEACLIFALLVIMSADTVTTGYSQGALNVQRTGAFFLMPTVLIVLIIGIAIGLAGSVVFIYYSHSLAGPLYRLERDMEKISGGDLTVRTNTRKTDQLGEIKESLNKLAASMDNGVCALQDIVSEAKRSVHKNPSDDNFIRLCGYFDRLESGLRKFRTTNKKKD